jgi:hypothetical protein
LVVFQGEDVGDHAVGANLFRVEQLDSAGEAVGLRERTNDAVSSVLHVWPYYDSDEIDRVTGGRRVLDILDLVDKDLGRGPRNTGSIGVDTVHQQSSAARDVVNGVVDD